MTSQRAGLFVALLKAENREFKEIIIELIDPVEYLAQAKRNLPNQEAALERFRSTMAGLQEGFKVSKTERHREFRGRVSGKP
jgi:hypothetical protein